MTWRRVLGWPGMIIGSLVLAAVSIPVLRDDIAYDPYSWVIWGREITHLQLNTRAAATSVKPLPMLYDTIFAVTGTHLPSWWLFVARAGTLLAFMAVFRLARRISGVPAGVVAVAGFAVSDQLLGYLFMRGMSEPMTAAALVAAVDCHLLGRRRAALACLVATAYLRPEAWPLLFAYLVWLAWRLGWWRRIGAVAVGCLVPFSWFLIDWFGARQFNRSATAATHQSQGGPLLHHHPGLATITETWHLASGPVVIMFLAGVGLAVTLWWRSGRTLDLARLDPPTLVSLITLAWVAIDAVLAQGHFATGAARYLLPAEALACVVAGWVVVEAGRWSARRLPAALPRLIVPAVAVAAVAVLVPSLVNAGRQLRTGIKAGPHFADLATQLTTAIRLTGGREKVLRCGAVTTRNFQVPLVAWQLHVPLDRVGTVVRVPGTVFRQAQVPAIPAPLARRLRTTADLDGSPLSAWEAQTSCPPGTG
jgi:hypothetical protein